MYCVSRLIEKDELNELMEECRRLPINFWLAGQKVEVKAYYQEELKGEVAGIIRAATDVEISALGVDVIITISLVETATYSHKDMLVLLSDLLNTIELAYNGHDDVPVIYIMGYSFRVNPAIVKYFGTDNKVMAPIFNMLDTGPGDAKYEDAEDEASKRNLYDRVADDCARPGKDTERSIYDIT